MPASKSRCAVSHASDRGRARAAKRPARRRRLTARAMHRTFDEFALPHPPPIPFIDVAAQRRRLGAAIDDAVAACLNHCQFILGPEVRDLRERSRRILRRRAMSVTLRQRHRRARAGVARQGIGPGDAVLCPSFTFCATAEVAALVGATPVFVDVDAATFNIDPTGSPAASRPPRTPGSSRRRSFRSICSACRPITPRFGRDRQGGSLFVLDDAAQGFGATYNNRRLGTLGQPRRRVSFRPNRSAATATAAR